MVLARITDHRQREESAIPLEQRVKIASAYKDGLALAGYFGLDLQMILFEDKIAAEAAATLLERIAFLATSKAKLHATLAIQGKTTEA
jgi:hypothetical protein